MRKLGIIACLVALLTSQGFADRVTSAYKQLQKGRYDKTKSLLDRAIGKQAINAGAHYIYALYFLTKENPAYQVDSSYTHIMLSLSHYAQIDKGDSTTWAKVGITLTSIERHRRKVESVAFSLAKSQNTITAYQTYVERFTTARELNKAIELRNQLAWNNAQALHSIAGYQSFIKTYPKASQVAEAQTRIDFFVYEAETTPATLKNLEAFLANNPQSVYRDSAVNQVFDLVSVNHQKATYEWFMKKYANSTAAKTAGDWLMSMYQNEGKLRQFYQQFGNYHRIAYVQQLLEVDSLQYFPILEAGRYGFIDQAGGLRIPIKYKQIYQDYLCEGIQDRFIMVRQNNLTGVIDKLGKTLIPVYYDQVEVLTDGVFKVVKNGMSGAFHQSGFPILPTVYDKIEVLNQYFLRVYRDGMWGVATLNGKLIVDCNFSEIDKKANSFVLFRKDNRYALIKNSQVFDQFLKQQFSLQLMYDEVDWIGGAYIKVLDQEKQGVVDTTGQLVLPPKFTQIKDLRVGWAARTSDSTAWQLYKRKGGLLSKTFFEMASPHDRFFVAKKQGKWGALSVVGDTLEPFKRDSLVFIGNVLLTFKGKQVLAKIKGREKPLNLSPYRFIKGERGNYPDAQPFVQVETRYRKKGLYNQKGKKMLAAVYDDILILADDLFSVKRYGRYGLVDTNRKVVLPIRYQGISNLKGGYQGLLLNRKFGLYHHQRKIKLEPKYASLPRPYSTSDSNRLFVVKKSHGFGLVDDQGKDMVAAKYQKIEYWTDSIALIKNEVGHWFLFNFITKQRLKTQDFNDIKYLKKEGDEIIALVSKVKFGILSNKRGLLIPMEYDLIYNLGSRETPMFFTERQYAGGKSFVVSYINHQKKVIWNKIMQEGDYHKILCEEY
ncbi:WG repeat-containing protein [uncultured Microscilla sp.]|uniref:WG repeat-containing protein n=1 Tax=uncultured Microscilla sp. TaxID=432653 RepID=UPI00260750D1|nr:WG repeat-containing protein [uncultured Microscilla sp.]